MGWATHPGVEEVCSATHAGVKLVNLTTHVVSGSKIGPTFDLAVALPGVQIQQQAAHMCTRRMSSSWQHLYVQAKK